MNEDLRGKIGHRITSPLDQGFVIVEQISQEGLFNLLQLCLGLPRPTSVRDHERGYAVILQVDPLPRDEWLVWAAYISPDDHYYKISKTYSGHS
jgi:hypothetical protein